MDQWNQEEEDDCDNAPPNRPPGWFLATGERRNSPVGHPTNFFFFFFFHFELPLPSSGLGADAGAQRLRQLLRLRHGRKAVQGRAGRGGRGGVEDAEDAEAAEAAAEQPQ